MKNPTTPPVFDELAPFVRPLPSLSMATAVELEHVRSSPL